jgi:hypothetical protein
MSYYIITGLVYVLYLLLPLVVLGVLIRRRVRPWIFGLMSLPLVILMLPAYCALAFLLPGWVWPPDILLPGYATRTSVALPMHHVAFVQTWGNDFYTTYFEITRADGAVSYLEIDGDDNKCWHLTTRRIGAKTYFLCDTDQITARTSYVDAEQSLVYAGFVQCSRHLDQLAYRHSTVNPLLADRWVSDTYVCFDTIPVLPTRVPGKE